MKPMQSMLSAKPMKRMPYIGGKPSPRIDMKGKRMAPTDLTNKAAMGTVPTSPSLPITSISSPINKGIK
jgi:hypothetical protein